MQIQIGSGQVEPQQTARRTACPAELPRRTKVERNSAQSQLRQPAHCLQTTLTTAQEAVVVALRKMILLPLDDPLAVTREFLCEQVSRCGLERCLRRHGVGDLVNKNAARARRFLAALYKACPIKIINLMTDNGKEFTDRLFASREKAPSGNHEFDQLCTSLGIEHRLTRLRTPLTNGMVECFNDRISDVFKTHHFNPALDREQTLMRYVKLCHMHFAAIGSEEENTVSDDARLGRNPSASVPAETL